MVVDIAPQQQLNEVFTTTRIHHRSSSSSIHRRSSTTTTTTSSLVSTENNTMTNGDRSMSDELSKKAEQILGQATDFFACRRQNSLDFQSQHAPRLNITASQPTSSSRNNMSQSVSSTTVHNSTTTTTISSQSVNSVTGDSSNGKNKRSITVEQLVPIILQLVAPTDFIPFPEMSSRRRSNSKLRENMRDSREMTVVLHRNNVLQLSDDENEEEQDDENEDEPENDPLDDDDEKNNNTNHFIENSTTVLTEITDNKTNSNSINQQTSNDNPLPPSQPPPPAAHVYENQVEPQHSGISSSRSQDDDDSEDEDSDTNPEAAYSDAENEDGQNETNPKMLSLMDFVCVKEIHSEPIESSLKSTSDSLSNVKKRSISPEPASNEDNHRVHNCEEHQNKRKKLLIKRALLKSFISSVNTKINFKRPSLPITIPTYLFFDQTSAPMDSNQSSEDERTQRTSKRSINGTLKHEPSSDPMDNSLPLSNNQTTPINGIHQKKNKTSHVQEKILSKQQDSTTTTTMSTNEQTTLSNSISSNEIESTKTRGTILSSNNNTATVSPIIAPQPKKEKPTANVKPLLQSTPMENLSLTNSINNGINSADSLTTSNTRAILPSNKTNYTRLKNMSKTDLAALARKKKKQADFGKRATFAEAREAMGLYLESVCYYIRCANVESKQDQRTSLLTTTLTMLQQLAQNHKKMFNISNNNQSGDLHGIQQKFLLINYWLQSLIYHLQLNTHMPTIERYANQVIDYFNQSKNPSSTSRNNTSNPHQQSTPINDTNPISPLSTTSQTSSSDMSTSSGNEQHRYIYDFSKLMLNSYHSTYYWNKAESLMREKTLKEFTEQLLKQNQNRRLSRDDPTLEFIVYIFDSIELLRLSVA